MHFKIALLLCCLAANYCHLSEGTKKGKPEIEDMSEKEMSIWLSKENRDSFSLINSHLVQSVLSRDSDLNMVVAEKFLRWKLRKTSGITNFLASKKDKALIRALKLFTALTGVPGKCTKESYAILFKNDLSTSASINFSPSGPAPLRRIEKIVHDYAIDHAKTCHHVYPVILKKKLATLNKEHLDRVQAFTDRVIENKIISKIKGIKWSKTGQTEIEEVEIAKRVGITLVKDLFELFILDLDEFQDVDACVETIEQFAVEDSNRKYLKRVLNEKNGEVLIQRNQVDALLNKYIIESCRYYTNELGDEIFKPAFFDSLWIKHKLEEDEVEFYTAWARFNICMGLIEEYNESFMVWFVRSLHFREFNRPATRNRAVKN